MGKSLKDRICEGLEDREGLIVPVIRNLMAEAWEEGKTAQIEAFAVLQSTPPNPYITVEGQQCGRVG